MTAPPTIHRPRRILVRGVNWLGDAVMTTPALLRLREAQPEATITLLTQDKLADLWTGFPGIDEVVRYAPGESPWTIGQRLRAHKFDVAVLFPNSVRSALEVFLAGIPRRIGYGSWPRQWLLTDPVARAADYRKMRKRSVSEIQRLVGGAASAPAVVPNTAHHLNHYLALCGCLGGSTVAVAPHVTVTANEMRDFATKFGIKADAVLARRFFGLNPGAEYGPAKRWPIENFAAAAAEIWRRTRCGWIIFGGPGDVDLARRLERDLTAQLGGEGAAHGAVKNLAGLTTLRELCAGLKTCDLLLTNDSGPMHLAAAVGSRVVVPFGSTSPELTSPGLPGEQRHGLLRANVPCAPCFLRECPIDFRCMRGHSVDDVITEVLKQADFATGN